MIPSILSCKEGESFLSGNISLVNECYSSSLFHRTIWRLAVNPTHTKSPSLFQGFTFYLTESVRNRSFQLRGGKPEVLHVHQSSELKRKGP